MVQFVGRAAELAEITSVIRAVLEGVPGPTVIAITGEAGVGKSRLLSEAVLDDGGAALRGIQVLHVTGYEPEQPVPLASAQPMLRALLPGDGPSPRDRIALFEAIHGALRHHPRPALIVLDDLQWVDEHSLALLHYIARGALAEGIPLGMVLASRPAARSVAFLASLGRLLGAGYRAVELPPLDGRDAAELARRLGAVSDAETISHRSGGSPFWIEVLARDVGRGRGDPAAPGDARNVVAGRPLPTVEVGRALGWPARRTQEALEELTAAGVARSGLGGAGLVHDLVR